MVFDLEATLILWESLSSAPESTSITGISIIAFPILAGPKIQGSWTFAQAINFALVECIN